MPDPTTLTTAQLYREIGALRELFETRFDGNDKAIDLLQRQSDRQPTTAALAIEMREKFAAIATQFQERDTRTEQSASSTKIAVDAALQAAKEAVAAQNTASAQAIAKSEAATTKQIDAIANQITAQAKSTDEKIDDVKGRATVMEGRLTTIEGVRLGEKDNRIDTRQGNRDSFAYVVGAVGMFGGLIGAAIGVASFLAK